VKTIWPFGKLVKHLDGSIGVLLENWTGMTQSIQVLVDGKKTTWSVYYVEALEDASLPHR
jgi:hypothetical protein